jgi:hypothetical protein
MTIATSIAKITVFGIWDRIKIANIRWVKLGDGLRWVKLGDGLRLVKLGDGLSTISCNKGIFSISIKWH